MTLMVSYRYHIYTATDFNKRVRENLSIYFAISCERHSSAHEKAFEIGIAACAA